MKKYFIYSYILIFCGMNFLYYQYYLEEKKQKQLIIDSQMFHDFEMAKEFLSSKLKNIYFRDLNTFLINKTLYSINNGNHQSISLLKTLYYKSYHTNKELLQELIVYDKNGKFLLSIGSSNDGMKKENIDLALYRDILKNDLIFIEYKSDNSFLKINPLVYQGSVVGYVKELVSFELFVNRFLSKYILKVLDPKKEELGKENRVVMIDSIGEYEKHIIMEPRTTIDQFWQLKKNFMINVLFSSVFLLLFFYLLYYSFKKEKLLKEEIRWQKEFFKKIVNASPNPIYVKDLYGNYLLANKATAKLFNIKNEYLMINKKDEDLGLGKELADVLKNEAKSSLSLKKIVYKELQKIEDRYYKFIHVPIFDYEYPINEKMVIGYATDISLEVQKKNELAKVNKQLEIDINDEMLNRFEINEKFKKIFNNIHNAMFVCKIDSTGKLSGFVDINSSGKIFLKRFPQFSDKSPYEIFDGFKFKYNNELDRFEVTKYSYILKIPHGDENINFQVSCNIIFVNNDFHAVIFIQLIDEVIKLKREKKEKQILLENIFKNAKSGIAVINRFGQFTRFNKSFYESLGVTKSYLLKHNFFSIFDQKTIDDVKKEHYTLFEEDKELSKEYRFHIKERSIDIIASSVIIEDSTGERLRLFIFEDITKQKQLELEQYQNSRIIAQQAKMAEMGEMIGAIAHQWRQPLNAINTAAIRLNFTASLDMLDALEIQEKAKFIEKQSLKMSETINDFMYFFKPSKNKESFYLSKIYQKIFDFLEPQLKNREIQMTLENPDDIIITGFQNEFEHILLNLINNAKDAFEDVSELHSKQIKVVASEQDQMIIIEVVDNAGGIPSNILNKVFNPYFTTKEEGKGTGIGLYMTKTIMDKHFNGSIGVVNNDDGAVFTLQIPKVSDV